MASDSGEGVCTIKAACRAYLARQEGQHEVEQGKDQDADHAPTAKTCLPPRVPVQLLK